MVCVNWLEKLIKSIQTRVGGVGGGGEWFTLRPFS